MDGTVSPSSLPGLTRQSIFFAKTLLRSGWTAELGFTRVRVSLMRKSDKSDWRGQARG
jgi:hypothetical protein